MVRDPFLGRLTTLEVGSLPNSFGRIALSQKTTAQDLSVSTVGDPLPLPVASPTTEDEWRQWALAVFGGNQARATAAAQAAAAARNAGASGDELFAAARAAYENAGSLAGTDLFRASPAGSVGEATDCIVRPSGRGTLGATLIGILAAGIVALIVRSGISSVLPVVPAAAVIMGAWYALSLRSSVSITRSSVCVQGVLHRREFRRLDVRQITVQPRSPLFGPFTNSPMRGQFLASFVGDDFGHLFELRQGAWTRRDIDRIGSAIGVQVVDDTTPSIT
jgi:hypothetical protein